MIQYISTLDLKDCEIDIGEIAVKCPFFNEIKDDQSKVPDYINSELDFFLATPKFTPFGKYLDC